MSLTTLSGYTPKYFVNSENVQNEISNYMLADGYDFVLDLVNSNNSNFVDQRTSKSYIDFFTCFASMPIGMNHKKMMDESFLKYMGLASLNKPSNSDIYTEEMATFVKTFFKVAVPNEFKYSFFIGGGSLAVENALKTAFDWKVRQNFRKGYTIEKGHKILHFEQAFHGRSGYTMSLTNTDPNKVALFPKFEWPRVSNPKITFPLNEENLAKVIELENISIQQIKQAFIDNKDDIAAIIIEPIQGEGGDNQFRNEFFAQLRHICDENDSLLIFDEVQTGLGLTGTMWAYQQTGVIPDILCFGKKMQVCGIIVTDKIDKEPDNVFKVSSRINSTWGGNFIDMVRSTKYLEIIEEENLVENAKVMGNYLDSKLNSLQNQYPEKLSNSRGKGLFRAIDFIDKSHRGKFVEDCFKNQIMILPSGSKSVRFRPPLNIHSNDIDKGFEVIEKIVSEI